MCAVEIFTSLAAATCLKLVLTILRNGYQTVVGHAFMIFISSGKVKRNRSDFVVPAVWHKKRYYKPDNIRCKVTNEGYFRN